MNGDPRESTRWYIPIPSKEDHKGGKHGQPRGQKRSRGSSSISGSSIVVIVHVD